MRFAFSVLACLAITNFCHAEDWTVKDKVYHNVTVVEVRPYVVFVTYDGGIGRPTFLLADLSPELQKRFNYDPIKAAQAMKLDASQSIAITLVADELWSDGGPGSYHNKVKEERPDAVKELEKHPLNLTGTVIYGHDRIYAFEAEPNASENAGGNPTTAATSLKSTIALDGKGGRCFLLSNQTFKEGQKVTVTVYPTRSASIEGKIYPCFSDDAGIAYDASHTWGF